MNAGTLLWSQLVTFVVLKLTGVIAWSWWLVLIPGWIILGFVALAVIFGLIGLAVAGNSARKGLMEIGRGLTGVKS